MFYKAFFATYGGGHVKSIIPIAKRLKSCSHDVKILGLTNSLSELDKAALDFINISRCAFLYTEKEQKEIYELGKSALINFPKMVNDTDSVWYHGFGLFELCKLIGRDNALNAYSEQGRKIFSPKHFASRVLKFINPDFVFVTCGQRFELAFAHAANELNIPVFRLIDLIGHNVSVDYKATILVGNEYGKECISTDLMLENKIVVTGNPNFEYARREPENTKSDSIHVSYFSQPGVEGRNNVLDVFNLLLNKVTKLKFTYKPHPSENLDDLPEVNRSIRIERHGDANDLIAKSDLVLTHFSSIGFQAINQNKRLVKVNFESRVFPVDFHSMGCAKEVNTPNDLINLLIALAEEKKVCFHREVTNYARFQQPRNSTERVVDIILDSLRNR